MMLASNQETQSSPTLHILNLYTREKIPSSRKVKDPDKRWIYELHPKITTVKVMEFSAQLLGTFNPLQNVG